MHFHNLRFLNVLFLPSAATTLMSQPSRDRNRSKNRDGGRVTTLFGLAGCLLITSAFSGCGPSQEDLMMKAAMRSRPKSNDEKEEEKAESQQVATPPVVQTASVEAASEPVGTTTNAPVPTKTPAATPSAAASANSSTEGKATTTNPVGVESLQPITQRQPDEPLSQLERRKRAANNLEKVCEALLAFKEDKGYYPASASSVSGLKTVSWRVELLPYLGYTELYKKFDLKKPWNREPNKSLLEFIPPEYVSPERFDTKTNLLFPAHKRFMFGDNRYPRDRRIEDGIENTIMLLEVDDPLAVEWTRPKDFEPTDLSDVRPGLGGLRADGTFAAWANGWTTVLPSTISAGQLTNALTYEDGDGQKAGAIHRELELEPIALQTADAPVAMTSTTRNISAKPASSAGPVALPRRNSRRAEQTRRFLPPPTEQELEKAQTLLTSIYGQRIQDAEEQSDHLRIADDMLNQSAKLIDDGPGAFALLAASMQQAIEGGGITQLLRAVDEQIRVFDVDPYRANVDALIAFSRQSHDDEKQRRNSDDFMRRSVAIIAEGVRRDDYQGAAQIAALAAREANEQSKPSTRTRKTRVARIGREDKKDEREKGFKQIRALLSSTSSQYDNAKDQVAAYRSDPSNGDAAAAVGRFMCFIKGDWDTGLPLLLQGGSKTLREVVQRDLDGGSNIGEQVALGDMWWDLGQRAKPGIYRQGALDRAAHWYGGVFESMPESLDKFHVKARLEELETMDPGSPLAGVRAVARTLRIDPDVTLEQIALSGMRVAAGGGGDTNNDDYTEG